MHILIADDDEIFSMMIEGICETMGHSSDVFSSGTDAMDKVKKNDTKYHAAILDVFMPGYNGDQIFYELSLKNDGEFPVLFCTGLTDSNNWNKLQKLGNIMSKEKAMAGLSYEIEKLEEWAMRLNEDETTRKAIMAKSDIKSYIKDLEHIANEAQALLDITGSDDVKYEINNPQMEERLTIARNSLASSLQKINI